MEELGIEVGPERNDPEHIQYPRGPRDKDRKPIHCRAYVGWNTKSPIFLDDPVNSNGKTTQEAYIKPLLDKRQGHYTF